MVGDRMGSPRADYLFLINYNFLIILYLYLYQKFIYINP